LAWGADPRLRARPGRIAEAICLMILVIAVNYGVYSGSLAQWITYPLSYAIFPLAIWSALRFGPKGVSTANLITMGLAVWGTVRGFGPFVQISVQAGLSHLSFTAVAGIAALLLAAVMAERGQAEEQIQKLARFPSENPNPVLRIAADGTVLYANNAGLPLLDAWGCRVGQAVPNEWRTSTLEVVQSGTSQEREFRLGELILSFIIAPVKGTDYVNIYGLDITRRRQAEQALEAYSDRLEEMVQERTQALHEAQEQLVRQEKLAMIGQLAGGIAHELRNPLGAIKNAAYLLQLTLEEPPEEAGQIIGIVDQQVSACARIIDSLLGFARTGDLVRQQMCVNDLIRDTLAQFSMPEQIEVVTELDASLPLIWADLHQLTLVLDNLIRNAAQAMPQGGQLILRSEVQDPGWVAISVIDTGTGISEENLARIFEPLFTTREQGIGLGLALAKILVEEGHSGSLQVTSKVGMGSTFLIRLPVAEELA
jgi:signal transduction histidine kinase